MRGRGGWEPVACPPPPAPCSMLPLPPPPGAASFHSVPQCSMLPSTPLPNAHMRPPPAAREVISTAESKTAANAPTVRDGREPPASSGLQMVFCCEHLWVPVPPGSLQSYPSSQATGHRLRIGSELWKCGKSPLQTTQSPSVSGIPDGLGELG